MSEQHADQSGDDTGSPGAGSLASEPTAHTVEAPKLVPGQDDAAEAGAKASDLKPETTKAGMPKAEPFTVESFKVDAPKPDAPKGDAPKADGPKADGPKTEGPKADGPKADALRVGTSAPRDVLIMAPGGRGWSRGEDQFEGGPSAPTPTTTGPGRGRRFAAMAAMVALAVIAGAAGGAFATIRLSHPTETAAAAAPDQATLEAAVGRIDADIMALKEGLERTTSAGLSQFNKTSDRLERIEKAQAEPNAKLAKLSDAVDKLRTAAAAAATPAATAAAKDITGTVTAPAGAQALPTPPLHAAPAVTAAGATPTTEIGRLPTVEGWALREASRGSALIEGRGGLYEVLAGDPVPGLGRVEAIRKQDGRWVVVTTKGLIVPR